MVLPRLWRAAASEVAASPAKQEKNLLLLNRIFGAHVDFKRYCESLSLKSLESSIWVIYLSYSMHGSL